jgi:GNAT superfamily N-acetyltransferase
VLNHSFLVQSKNTKLEFHPLTPERWRDFENLFGERGACGGCWCMWSRLSRAQYETQKGARNKRAMKKLVDGGRAPGIIAYQNGQPIGWCSVAPREEFLRLERSRILKPVDEQPVWSVVCFFVAKEHRGRGISAKLLKAAIDFVRERGGRIVEGYPVEPQKKQPDAFMWTGLAAAFAKAGFEECARRSATRPVMRYTIKK